jgi:hypothetical protein
MPVDFCIILTTAGSQDEADRLAEMLVTRRDNRMPFPVRSPKQSAITGIASPPSAVRNHNSSNSESPYA